nr:hypothetical protein Cry52Nrm1_p114 [Cryptomonas curvata]
MSPSLNIEFYRLKNIVFQRTRQSCYMIMLNLKNLNNVAKTNTSLILDSLYYSKEIIEKNKILPEMITVLWDNYKNKFSGYIYNTLSLKSFTMSYYNKNFKMILNGKYMDINCSFFDIFHLFQKSCIKAFPIVSLKEGIFFKIITMCKTIKKTIKNLRKSSLTLKCLFWKIKDFTINKIFLYEFIYKYYDILLFITLI